MKLNTDIISFNLPGSLAAEIKGIREKTLHLGRPEYYLGEEQSFLSGHLYIAKGEHLPSRPKIEKGSAVICVGDSLYLPYYLERCGVIHVKSKIDLPRLFNMLTSIYNKYDQWNEELVRILNTSASVGEMLACSQEIFKNPIFVLNASFQYIAHSGYSSLASAEWNIASVKQGDELALPMLSKFLELHELSTDVKEPMLLNLLDSSTLNVNLFEDGAYNGCLTIDYRHRPYHAADYALAEHLARMVELALKKYSSAATNERSALRHVFHDVIEGLPIAPGQRWVLEAVQRTRVYICVKIQFSSRLAQLPVGYMCSALEKEFPKSVAFEYDGAIVSFIETQALRNNGRNCHQVLRERITPLISSMNFDIGVSDPFSDIYGAQLYYLQACAALENGRLFEPQEHFYLFQNYALTELIINALGKLPVEMYFTDGLRRLARHDLSSAVSYIQTLRAYLENNMSISKTARKLFISRSTLIERISRIKRDLNTDLSDPDERLMFLILLKALDIQNKLQMKPEQ